MTPVWLQRKYFIFQPGLNIFRKGGLQAKLNKYFQTIYFSFVQAKSSTQLIFTCWNQAIEIIEKGVKYFQSCYLYCYLWTYFSLLYSVSIVDSKKVNLCLETFIKNSAIKKFNFNNNFITFSDRHQRWSPS